MKTLFRILLFPIAWPVMALMAWVCCIMTWGTMSWKNCYDGMWKDYWGGR